MRGVQCCRVVAVSGGRGPWRCSGGREQAIKGAGRSSDARGGTRSGARARCGSGGLGSRYAGGAQRRRRRRRQQLDTLRLGGRVLARGRARCSCVAGAIGRAMHALDVRQGYAGGTLVCAAVSHLSCCWVCAGERRAGFAAGGRVGPARFCSGCDARVSRELYGVQFWDYPHGIFTGSRMLVLPE